VIRRIRTAGRDRRIRRAQRAGPRGPHPTTRGGARPPGDYSTLIRIRWGKVPALKAGKPS